ncbi:hypothetical protein KVR01_008122 [Diaporthe batatas]|uniref:uncharacterized protein n=1 Tax=Diaporthe batatas TaxID=748121 RepID=UPI001D03D405|nr:uncharacterized protein KVR01_008122 [Diaporthe batatas]KAG8162357.1 hypothetical protein KVR01_008122 [Diaporthe batatas]
MHANTLFFSIMALSGVVVSTKGKGPGPSCPEQEYYNKMMESRNRKAAVTDCAKWLNGDISGAEDMPRYFRECSGDKDDERVSRVSAACSCIATSSASSTASSTVIVTTSTSSSSSEVSSTSAVSTPPSVSDSSSVASTSEQPPTASSTDTSPTSGHTDPTSTATGSHTTSAPATVSSSPQTSDGTTASTAIHISDSAFTSATHSSNSEPAHSSSSQFESTRFPSTDHSSSSSTISQSNQLETTLSQATTASTVLVTSTIAISTTVCPVIETPQPAPSGEDITTTKLVTSTLYTTTTSTLTRCPPGATYCPVGNIPITKTVPIGETVLTTTTVVPAGEQSNAEKHPSSTPSVTPSRDNNGNENPSYTVISVPTTIYTVMNGVTAQILTVIPVTSALPVGKASLSDATLEANAWQGAEAGGSDLAAAPPIPPGNQTAAKGSTSSRLPVVTAGAAGVGSSDGVRAAFLVFVLALFF